MSFYQDLGLHIIGFKQSQKAEFNCKLCFSSNNGERPRHFAIVEFMMNDGRKLSSCWKHYIQWSNLPPNTPIPLTLDESTEFAKEKTIQRPKVEFNIVRK
jgi:hypothetical protein